MKGRFGSTSLRFDTTQGFVGGELEFSELGFGKRSNSAVESCLRNRVEAEMREQLNLGEDRQALPR